MRTISAYGIASACLLVVTANAYTATPTLFNKLMKCQGDCNKNSDCASGVCFKRDGYHAVPGCKGKGHKGKDYCTTQKAINKAKAEAEAYEKSKKALAKAAADAKSITLNTSSGCSISGNLAALSEKLIVHADSLQVLQRAETKACPVDVNVDANSGWSTQDLNGWGNFAQTATTTKTAACDAAMAKVAKAHACSSKLMDRMDVLEKAFRVKARKAAQKKLRHASQAAALAAQARRMKKAAATASKKAAAAAAKQTAATAAAKLTAATAAVKKAAAAAAKLTATTAAAKKAAKKVKSFTPKKASNPFQKAPSDCFDGFSNCKSLASQCCSSQRLIDACCKSCHASAQSKKCIAEKSNDVVGGNGRINVKFDHKDVANRIAENSTCSQGERKEIVKSTLMMEHWMRKAYKNWGKPQNKKLFLKWFGRSTKQSNENVKIRFQHAMKMMFATKKQWKMMCCKQAIGGCRGCGSQTLAYVTHFTKGEHNRTHANVNIRMCALSFKQKYKEVRIGMTIFHELMHMSSRVGDQGYTKKQCFNLARTNPERARLNAAAYVYYAIESSMTKDNYEKYSTGGSVMNEGCSDTWGNCYQMAKSCCHGKTVSDQPMAKGCCASCHHFDKKPRCKSAKQTFLNKHNGNW